MEYYKTNNWLLYHWDCLEVMKNIDNESIDAIICDTPYWTTACKWDIIIPFDKMREQLKRIIKPNWAIALFWSEPFSSALRMSNIKNYKYDWIWEKNAWSNFASVRFQPMKEHENISIFWQWKINYYPILQERSESWKDRVKSSAMTFNRKKTDDIYNWLFVWNITKYKANELRCPRSIQKFNRERWLHPTQKPVALIEYLIKTYTNESQTILDFTSWSWTLAVACENTNRKWICIEKEEKYCKVTKQRLEKLSDNLFNQ
jgi:site-specific DNA-methyltransferase (adenine-specific)